MIQKRFRETNEPYKFYKKTTFLRYTN